MAAAVASNTAIDLGRTASFSVQVGQSISKPAEHKCYTSVRFNHKPTLERGTPCRIFRSDEGNETVLRLGDGDGDGGYTFEGNGGALAHNDLYILLPSGSSNSKDWTLERLSNSFAFNLMSTPSESDTLKLRERYAQINDEAEAAEDRTLSGDDDDEGGQEPDDDNPFDFRHFLKEEALKAQDVPPSGAATPTVIAARPSANTPVARPVRKANAFAPAQKKRKAQPADKAAAPKRVKAPQTTQSNERASGKTSVPDAPQVRLDRRASLRKASVDDSGELILENESAEASRRTAPSAMSLALTGQLGGGPISLRSAANSPASQMGTPDHRTEAAEPSYEFELGGDSEEDDAQPHGNNVDTRDHDDDDADVEDLELPSPAQIRRPSTARKQSMARPDSRAGDDYDDDDLEKELELAMAEDDEEESEEE